ncbi:hypothetical protein COCMIDRAFT_38964 [Bipolaris oryzae ATCC 44560]|uniref:Uncharacterized protein n=1 Tax=Bipolaris oryzae ATCC 44560 TaxID=930090 RepID=W6YZP5_COCMI|nr:uncharacterized protein COCMIDRAFT_38964 [Bipolaris oryzae ATCC 44560]EUC43058.1 hypothetical protein COCMIDRAFT_38964 [Bipolaris oryzae ATCC 44560]
MPFTPGASASDTYIYALHPATGNPFSSQATACCHRAQTLRRALLLSSLVLCARLIPDGHLPGLELPRNIGPFAEAGGFIVGSLFNGYPSHSPLLATRGSCG